MGEKFLGLEYWWWAIIVPVIFAIAACIGWFIERHDKQADYQVIEQDYDSVPIVAKPDIETSIPPNHDQSLSKIDRGLEAGDELPLELILRIGIVQQKMGRAESAEHYYQVALEQSTSKSNIPIMAAAMNNLGLLLRHSGNLHEALGVLDSSVTLSRNAKDRWNEGKFLSNLGTVYRDMGDTVAAISAYEESLEISREVGNPNGESAALGNIGLVCLKQGEWGKALDCQLQALQINVTEGDRLGQAGNLGHIGLVYHSQGEYDLALDYHRQSLDLNRSLDYRRGEAAELGNIGNVYWDLRQLDSALEYMMMARDIFSECGYTPFAEQADRAVLKIKSQIEE